MDKKMTFEELTKIEPGLKVLKDAAIKFMANSPGGYGKRNTYWYRNLKPRFTSLVGFMAKNPKLETCEAYDLAYQELCSILKIW